MVPRGDGLWINGGEGSILPYQPKIDNEKNNECKFMIT